MTLALLGGIRELFHGMSPSVCLSRVFTWLNRGSASGARVSEKGCCGFLSVLYHQAYAICVPYCWCNLDCLEKVVCAGVLCSKIVIPPPLLLYLADILEKILWGYIPLSAHTFFHWFTFVSKTCVQQVLFCLLTSDFPFTYINMNSVVREDCPFTPVSLFNQIFLYPHKLMNVFFSLWIIVQFYHFLFCCSNCSVLATQSSCGLASRSLASQGSSTFFSLIAAAA